MKLLLICSRARAASTAWTDSRMEFGIGASQVRHCSIPRCPEFDCVLQQYQTVGSHSLLIGRIVATQQLCDGNPVINFQGELRTLPVACRQPSKVATGLGQ